VTNPSPKAVFIGCLRLFVKCKGRGLPDEYGHPDYAPSRGEVLLAGAFADYLSQDSVPNGDQHENWHKDLGRYLVDAYTEFRTADRWDSLRAEHGRQVEGRWDIPDLLDIRGGVYRALLTHSLCRLMPLLAGEENEHWLRASLQSYFDGQNTVVHQSWDRFVRVAYRGLMPRIKDETHRGNSGVFGDTELMTYDCAGRVLFGFKRGDSGVTFIADASDMYGLRSGLQTARAPYQECVAMIDDVTDHWDMARMKRSDSIGIGL
jgi:hypothetical protein